MSNSLPAITRRSWLQRARKERSLRRKFFKSRGYRLNTRAPRSFSEKLFCRMIAVNRHDDRVMTYLSDKLRVRDFVAHRVGKSYLADLLWHGTDIRSAPFDVLPDEYMIKANHGSKMNLLVRRDTERETIFDHASKWMKTDFGSMHGEFHYYGIDRRLLIEEILDDGHQGGPLGYRMFCFDGAVEVIQVDDNSHSINPFYDRTWKRVAGGYRTNAREVDIERPPNFDEMIDVASRLSHGIDFVRVDVYNLKGRIILGEMTFTPVAGNARFNPASWESWLGECWRFDARPLELREGFGGYAL